MSFLLVQPSLLKMGKFSSVFELTTLTFCDYGGKFGLNKIITQIFMSCSTDRGGFWEGSFQVGVLCHDFPKPKQNIRNIG